jgi:hypothetical protein
MAKREQVSKRDNDRECENAAARRCGRKRAGGAGEKLIIELTISGRCRRHPCADAADGEDAEPGPFLRSLTPSFPSVLLAVAEEKLDVEDDEVLAERACQKDINSSECPDSMRTGLQPEE